MALGDTIQQDDDEDENYEEEEQLEGPHPAAEDSVTLVDLVTQTSVVADPENPTSESLPWADAENGGEAEADTDTRMSPSQSSREVFLQEDDDDDDVTVKQPHLSQAQSVELHFSASDNASPLPPESFQSPSNPSEGLLSPIQISSLPPVCFPPLHSLHREDSIDSGYADGWTGPSPLLISPPRSPRRVSTLSILSSPFGSPTSRMLQFGPATVPPISPSVTEFAESRHSPHDSDIDSVISGREDEDGDEVDAFVSRLHPSIRPESRSGSPSLVQTSIDEDLLPIDHVNAASRDDPGTHSIAMPDSPTFDSSDQHDDSFPISLYAEDVTESENASPTLHGAPAMDNPEESRYSLYAGYFSPEPANEDAVVSHVTTESSPRAKTVFTPVVERGRRVSRLQTALSPPRSHPNTDIISENPGSPLGHTSSPKRESLDGILERRTSSRVPFGFRSSSSVSSFANSKCHMSLNSFCIEL